MLELQLRVSKGKASQIKAHILWIFLVCWDPWNLLGIDRLGSGKNDRFRKNKTPFLRCHVMIFFVTISHRNAVKFKWCAICTEKEHVKMRQGRNKSCAWNGTRHSILWPDLFTCFANISSPHVGHHHVRNLVVEPANPLKNMTSSVGMMKFPIHGSFLK